MAVSSVAARVGEGVEVIPYVPILLGGVGSLGEEVRAIFEFDAWLMSAGLGTGVELCRTRASFWGGVIGGGGG